MPVLRIEILEGLHRDPGKITHLLEVQHFVYLEGIGYGRKGHLLRDDPVLFVICHCVKRPDKSRYIASGFSRKIRVNVPECPLSAAAADCLVDVPCTAVV